MASEEKAEEEKDQPIRMAGVDDPPPKGWRSEQALDILAGEDNDVEDDHHARTNGNGPACSA